MAHWAELDADDNVLRVIVCDPDDGADGAKSVPQWITDNLGGTWVRTYYGTPGRVYAGIGFRFDRVAKDFAPPRGHP